MKWLYKLFRQDPESREGVIATTSGLGIVVNLLIAIVKMIVGFMASSIAIVSEGANNAADALTSVLTLAGTKLAAKHPDEKHPFGYGRIEYLTGLVVSVLILVTGIEMLKSAVELVFHPEELSVSYLSVIIVAASAVVKYCLGSYTIQMGKKTGSSALEAVGIEGRSDSYVSLVTIFSALLFVLFHISVDAYAGIITSCFILKAGWDVLMETISELIGRSGEQELATKLYKEIRGTEGVLAAADMMLHNYGPDRWSGSVNLEVDHKKTVGEAYQFLHELQLRIMHEYDVTMVFGIYAVDNDREHVKDMRRAIGHYVREQEHVLSYHALYLEPVTQKIYCDFIVDYALQDWEALRRDFTAYMKKIYPESELELTIETEFV